MNRLYILLTVMVVMVRALFAGQEALAKVLTGPPATIRSWGPTGTTASRVATGRTASRRSRSTGGFGREEEGEV
jgi:hypothetical protein